MDLRNQQIKDTYANLTTIGTVAGSPTTGTLQNGQGTNVTALTIDGDLSATNVSATSLTGTLATAAQTNITSVGTLSGLAVSGTTGLDGAVTINESGANVDFRVEGDTDQNLLFVDASADRVGIGINAPTEKLDVGGLVRSFVSGGSTRFIATDGTTEARFGTFATGIAYVGTHTNHPFLLYSNNAERLRIDSSGNVGIGVSPSYKLDVNGVVNANGILIGTNGDSINKSGANFFIQTTSDNDVIIRRNSGEKVRITTNGLTFNGDTAAANALDDYEEATWSVASTTGVNCTSITLSDAVLTKIGRQITLIGKFSATLTTTATATGISFPLPFAQLSNLHESVGTANHNLVSTTYGEFSGVIDASGATTTNGFIAIPASQVLVANGSSFIVSFTYTYFTS